MKVEEYLKTLPSEIMSGEDAVLPDSSVHRILDFAEFQPGETFCHLGCGRGDALRVAAGRGARVSGVEVNPDKACGARRALGPSAEVSVGDITSCPLPAADIILLWFADHAVIQAMAERLSKLDPATRIVTIWGPLPGCLPDSVRFPFILSRPPFRQAPDVRSQIRAVFGVDCVSYATAWEYAERYTKEIQPGNSQNDRFLTILQTLTIWCAARSMHITCEKEIPPSVHTYAGIMRNFFGIDFGHLLE